MTDTATFLSFSRTAHKKKEWQTALNTRLDARALDPDRRDPAWLDDALAPPRQGVTGKQYHRMPGKTLAQVAAVKDMELEVFFRGQLNPAPPVENSIQIEKRVVVPSQWSVKSDGVRLCTCGHPDDDHDDLHRCVRVDSCSCEDFSPLACKHSFETMTDIERRCVGCGELQTLVPTMALEETEAFKQGTREAQR